MFPKKTGKSTISIITGTVPEKANSVTSNSSGEVSSSANITSTALTSSTSLSESYRPFKSSGENVIPSETSNTTGGTAAGSPNSSADIYNSDSRASPSEGATSFASETTNYIERALSSGAASSNKGTPSTSEGINKALSMNSQPPTEINSTHSTDTNIITSSSASGDFVSNQTLTSGPSNMSSVNYPDKTYVSEYTGGATKLSPYFVSILATAFGMFLL
ncbi:unnamed protein product [[Candida] boidinii]|nr:unnamed protein product [[Candida] boidinii]